MHGGLDPSQCKVMQKKCTICNKKCSEAGHKNELYCTVCTGKCHVSKHVNDKRCTECEDECSDPNHPKTPWKYVSKTRRVKKDIQQLKEMYEKGKEGSEESVHLDFLIEKMKEKGETEKVKKLEEMKRNGGKSKIQISAELHVCTAWS
ncbi:hypothetical protein F7725_021277 [Dissostichus mawsoni]|uniref:Uncharacterized protein n=1 Tax=Dissostichus mawsoni TaxID=36200 RepID=A0A7J5YHK1_DISMA|nr:hypothetical protein F7725_021277 [Dissostichus mawsoni]